MVNGAAHRDDVAATLRELAEHYARTLDRTARVDQVYGRGISIRLRPTRPGAVEVGWREAGGELEIVVGAHGWRRIGHRPVDVGSITVLCDAVIAGHGYEIAAPGRALVTLTPADGPEIRLITRTGGAVPLPLWTRWGRRTPYAPYDRAR